MKIVLGTIVVFVVLGLGGAVSLYMKNKSLANENIDLESKIEAKEAEIANLKDEKTTIEQDVAVWKATDLDKEAQLLRLKLDTMEKDLTTAKKRAAKLKTNLQKTKLHADALAAVDNFFGRPMTNANLNNIDVKIDALNDGQITAQWMRARVDINVSENSWGTNGVVHTLFLIVSKIRDLAF